MRLRFVLATACALTIAALDTRVSVHGDEGMWRLDQLPLDTIAQKYNVRLAPRDVERLQRAPVRLLSGSGGGTGTFASVNGLILTNHHVALDCIRKVEVLEYAELGMEAVWRIEVENFPAFIVMDDKGNDFYTGLG